MAAIQVFEIKLSTISQMCKLQKLHRAKIFRPSSEQSGSVSGQFPFDDDIRNSVQMKICLFFAKTPIGEKFLSICSTDKSDPSHSASQHIVPLPSYNDCLMNKTDIN